MNVGFLIPSMERGGAERAMSILCNQFAERGHNVFLMLSEDSSTINNPLSEYVTIVDVVDNHSFYGARIPRYIKKIKNTICKHKIDLVISFIVRTNVNAIIACRMLNVPVIVSERNDPYTIPNSKLSKIIRDFVYRFADGFVFQTEYAQHYFNDSIVKRSEIIVNPTSDEIKAIPDVNEKDKVIICVSRLAEQKNIILLINAFNKIKKFIPDYRLEIYGEGPDRGVLEQHIKTLSLQNKVFLMGLVKDVILRVSRAKTFVLSSNFEGLSNALLEALCVGTACVATDSPTYGNRALIKDGVNGFLVPVNDLDALAEKMLLVTENDELNARLSQQAKMLYKETNSKTIADKWELYIYKLFPSLK